MTMGLWCLSSGVSKYEDFKVYRVKDDIYMYVIALDRKERKIALG